MAFASVAPQHMIFTRGENRLRSFRSTSFGRRGFCGACGTPLTIEVDFQPENVDFTIGSLDEPSRVVPGFYIFRSSRIARFETDDDLARHERFRPTTRGLAGEEPPA